MEKSDFVSAEYIAAFTYREGRKKVNRIAVETPFRHDLRSMQAVSPTIHNEFWLVVRNCDFACNSSEEDTKAIDDCGTAKRLRENLRKRSPRISLSGKRFFV